MTEKKETTVEMEFDGEKFTEVEKKYTDKYSEKGLWNKITGSVKKAGLTLIFEALQLFYVAQRPDCPMKIKAAIFAALGMFISPIDFIPDFTPIVGFTDDAAAVGVALIMAHALINEDVKQKARDKLKSLFGEKVLGDKF